MLYVWKPLGMQHLELMYFYTNYIFFLSIDAFGSISFGMLWYFITFLDIQ